MSWRIPVHIPLPEGFQGFDPRSRVPQVEFNSYERHLPHWRMPGACYLTTFRLNDSLPADILQEMRDQLKAWKRRLLEASAKHGSRLPVEEHAAWVEFQRGHLLKVESLLDEGRGECLLRHEGHRHLVEVTLHHLEGQRFEMMAFAIMPNHVHALCRPVREQDLEKLTASWKRHSSESLNRRTGRRGRVWQQETFDRIIRDGDHFRQAVRYIAKNPVQARLQSEEATVWFNPAIMEANGWMSGP
jgi:putative transposase